MNPSSAALGALLALSTPATASAQDFLGGLARRAAESAAQSLVNRAGEALTRPRGPAQTPAAPPRPEAAPAVAATTVNASTLPADFPQPRPMNYSPNLRRPGQLEFSDADRAAKIAFDEIGRYSCNDCEGGRSYDSWPRHEISGLGSGNYALENRLGALAVGEALRWTGSRTRTRYAITVVSDQAIGQWQCKQLKWTGDRDSVHAERLGLICKPTENWHTIL